MKTIGSIRFYGWFSSWTIPSLASRKLHYFDFPPTSLIIFLNVSFVFPFLLLFFECCWCLCFLYSLRFSLHGFNSYLYVKPTKDLYRLNVSLEFQTHIFPCLLYISLGCPTKTLNLAYPTLKSVTKSLSPSLFMLAFTRLLLCLCLF